MSISVNDLELRYSNPAASAGSQLAQMFGDKSLGGFIATSPFVGISLHELFQPITGAANASLTVEFAALFLLNKHQTLTATAISAWISSAYADGVDLAIGVDPVPASRLDSTVLQARTVASRLAPPPGVLFSSPLSDGDGVQIGALAPGYCRAIWFRRTATGTVGIPTETWDIDFSFDTV